LVHLFTAKTGIVCLHDSGHEWFIKFHVEYDMDAHVCYVATTWHYLVGQVLSGHIF